MIGIYKIENLINHKIYIGQSTNIQKRWIAEKNRAFQESAHEYDYPLCRAFRKYGIDNFSFEIIEECKIEQLNEKEKFWINYYNSFFEGYNQTFGGDSGIVQKGNKDHVIGIMTDLETTDMCHREIATKWNISVEMVQGINTGRYWHMDNKQYPLQKTQKIKRVQNYCEKCGKPITQKAKLCILCSHQVSQIVERPDRETLKMLIRTTPFVTIAKQYGVSDTAIRKWCDAYGLPRQKYVIKSYSDVEWENV